MKKLKWYCVSEYAMTRITCDICEDTSTGLQCECGFKACRKCAKRIIFEQTTPHCGSGECDRKWDRIFLYEGLGKGFMMTEYKTYRENVLYDEQVEVRNYVERTERIEMLKFQLTRLGMLRDTLIPEITTDPIMRDTIEEKRQDIGDLILGLTKELGRLQLEQRQFIYPQRNSDLIRSYISGQLTKKKFKTGLQRREKNGEKWECIFGVVEAHKRGGKTEEESDMALEKISKAFNSKKLYLKELCWVS